jgi:hypothetical protein
LYFRMLLGVSPHAPTRALAQAMPMQWPVPWA